MRKRWMIIKKTLKDAYQNAFFSSPFQIICKDIDALTKQANFFIKAKRIPTALQLKTEEILNQERFFSGLSSEHRKEIIKQHLLEIKSPQAYIYEFPITENKNNEYIFKIFLLENKKILCGNASYFIKKQTQILALLSQNDFIKLVSAYSLERFGTNNTAININEKNHIHYLK